MNYRSPLSRARGLGSAGHGLHHWTLQRFSAIALIPLALWFAFSLASLDGFSYESFLDWMEHPWVPALTTLFFAIAYYHASLGIQVVIEDYVSNEMTRGALLIVVKLFLLLMAVSTIVSVLVTAL
jgi:succinate dehydrogenase / fumarate reductase membrane anchor subunit